MLKMSFINNNPFMISKMESKSIKGGKSKNMLRPAIIPTEISIIPKNNLISYKEL